MATAYIVVSYLFIFITIVHHSGFKKSENVWTSPKKRSNSCICVGYLKKRLHYVKRMFSFC